MSLQFKTQLAGGMHDEMQASHDSGSIIWRSTELTHAVAAPADRLIKQ